MRQSRVHPYMVAFAVLGLGVSSCAARPAQQVGPAPAPVSAPRVTPGTMEGGPLLAGLPAEAARHGAGPLAIVVSGPMNEGERMGAFVEIPKDACLLAYARGSSSLEDVDLAAFAEEGSPVAVDEGPDPKPTLLVCPPHPDRVYVAVHAAAGQGLCVVGAQLVPKARGDEVARAVDAHGAMGGLPKSPEKWPGLDDQVRAHRAAIGGTWDEQRRVAVPVDSRSIASVAFVVDEGGCADAVVVPDDDVASVDVEVLDADGRLVARAKDSSTARAVTVCSPIAMSGSLQVRPHVGRGLAAVVVAKAKPETVREMQTRADVAWVAPVQSLDATRGARNAILSKEGYGAPISQEQGQLVLGRRVMVPVSLGGGCHRIDVVAGAPLALVDAAAWDDAGSLLATADGAAGATLFACGKGKARVDLGTRARPGPYAVLVRPERWKDPALAAHPLAAGRMLSRAASGPAAIHEGKASAIHAASLDAQRQHVRAVSVPAKSCLRVAVGAEGEGTGIEMRVVDVVTGTEIDRSHGQTAAAISACAGESVRSVRIESRATAGKLDAVFGERIVPEGS